MGLTPILVNETIVDFSGRNMEEDGDFYNGPLEINPDDNTCGCVQLITGTSSPIPATTGPTAAVPSVEPPPTITTVSPTR